MVVLLRRALAPLPCANSPSVGGCAHEFPEQENDDTERKAKMGDQHIRAALDRHWAASQAGDDDAEDEIYHDDAVLEYPQSGERIRGRLAIRTTRGLLPNKQFTIRRVLGRGDLWVTEYVISYDGKPSHTVSIMEFRNGKVFRETQYFGDPFEPWSGRAQWVEPID